MLRFEQCLPSDLSAFKDSPEHSCLKVSLTLFVQIVMVVCNVPCLIRHGVAYHPVRQDVPYAWSTAFVFCSSFDLIGCGCYTPPELFGKLPGFILGDHWTLLSRRKRRIVQRWRWNQLVAWYGRGRHCSVYREDLNWADIYVPEVCIPGQCSVQAENGPSYPPQRYPETW